MGNANLKDAAGRQSSTQVFKSTFTFQEKQVAKLVRRHCGETLVLNNYRAHDGPFWLKPQSLGLSHVLAALQRLQGAVHLTRLELLNVKLQLADERSLATELLKLPNLQLLALNSSASEAGLADLFVALHSLPNRATLRLSQRTVDFHMAHEFALAQLVRNHNDECETDVLCQLLRQASSFTHSEAKQLLQHPNRISFQQLALLMHQLTRAQDFRLPFSLLNCVLRLSGLHGLGEPLWSFLARSVSGSLRWLCGCAVLQADDLLDTRLIARAAQRSLFIDRLDKFSFFTQAQNCSDRFASRGFHRIRQRLAAVHWELRYSEMLFAQSLVQNVHSLMQDTILLLRGLRNDDFSEENYARKLKAAVGVVTVLYSLNGHEPTYKQLEELHDFSDVLLVGSVIFKIPEDDYKHLLQSGQKQTFLERVTQRAAMDASLLPLWFDLSAAWLDAQANWSAAAAPCLLRDGFGDLPLEPELAEKIKLAKVKLTCNGRLRQLKFTTHHKEFLRQKLLAIVELSTVKVTVVEDKDLVLEGSVQAVSELQNLVDRAKR